MCITCYSVKDEGQLKIRSRRSARLTFSWVKNDNNGIVFIYSSHFSKYKQQTPYLYEGYF